MNADRREPVDWIAWSIALAVAALSILYRLAPYSGLFPQNALWNLMPVGALALFAGSRLRTPWGLLIPLVAMLVSDLLLIAPLSAAGMKAISWGTPLIYASFAAYFALGLLVRRDSFAPLWVTGAAVLGSAQFFLITNFLAWRGKSLPYTDDLAGLLQCYVAGLPFHQNTLMADIVFSLSFFALHLVLLAVASGVRERQPA